MHLFIYLFPGTKTLYYTIPQEGGYLVARWQKSTIMRLSVDCSFGCRTLGSRCALSNSWFHCICISWIILWLPFLPLLINYRPRTYVHRGRNDKIINRKIIFKGTGRDSSKVALTLKPFIYSLFSTATGCNEHSLADDPWIIYCASTCMCTRNFYRIIQSAMYLYFNRYRWNLH